MARRTALAIASAALGLLLVAGIVAWAGPAESLAALAQMGALGCARYTAWCFLILFLQGLGWWILLRGESPRANLGMVVEGMLMGHALSAITPSAYLGGEPIRAWFASHRLQIPMRRAFATVLLHKFQEMSGFLVLLVIGMGVVLAEYRTTFSLWANAGLLGFTTAATVFFLVVAWSFVRRRAWLSGACAWVAHRWHSERWARVHAVCRDIEDKVHQALSDRLRGTLIAHALTASTLVLVWLKPALLLAIAGAPPLSFAQLCLFFVATQVLMAFQPTPGGLGVNEGGFVGVYSLLGVPPSQAIAFMAAVRVADGVLVGAGLLLATRCGWSALLATPSPPAESDPDPGGSD